MLRSPLILQAAGTALAFALTDDGVPVVTHWGASPSGDPEAFAAALARSSEPSIMNSSFDRPRVVGVLPSQHQGWSGAPALELHRGHRALFPRLALQGTDATDTSVTFRMVDAANGIESVLSYELDVAGCLHAQVTVRNSGADELQVQAVRLLLPIPPRADELLDLTGRWTGERRPQRGRVLDGAHVRANRRGRTGHDAALLAMVGTRGFAFRRGEVWGAHVAWSGDSEHRVERLPEGFGTLSAIVGGGELLNPGEIVLSPGGVHSTPEVVFVWSDDGIDGLSRRLHATVRHGAAYPATPRPVTLNTWEAVYFDQSFDRLAQLAATAHEIGLERFVLDDGWFARRRDDSVGLGDWFVDEAIWPDGLEPLAARVRELGMEFGLWFEPEMVNPGSVVAVEHPDWILAPTEGVGPTWRHQHVLNLADEGAFAHLFTAMDALIDRLDLRYIKWDHNRDLHEAVNRRSGASGVHEQTLAFYRLVDALRAKHPHLEIESCASGGGRIDLGVMRHAQRVWASDTNDAIERQRIQKWTTVLLPPEVVGSHVGPDRSHTTARNIDLSFRLLTALFAHAGIEWNIADTSPRERRALADWVSFYRTNRELLSTGSVVRADDLPSGSMLHGVVAADSASALYCWAQIAVGALAYSPRIPLPGLDPDSSYQVEVIEPFGAAERRSVEDPEWLQGGDPWLMSGDALGRVGLPLPVLHPGQGLLLRCTRM